MIVILIFQETVVRMAIKLLSPPMPSDSPGTGDANHYLTHMRMLNAVLSCLCHVDSVHILSLYGMVSFSSLLLFIGPFECFYFSFWSALVEINLRRKKRIY
jgi:hypothetical protein